MTAWLLSIVGIVFLGVMVDIIAPSGKTNAFIKSIFAIFLIYVVITPIVKYIKKGEYKVDFETEYSTENLSVTEAEHKISDLLISNGFYGIDVEIKGYVSKDKIMAQKVVLNGAKTVLKSQDEHIDKYKLITNLVQSIVTVKKENIEYA